MSKRLRELRHGGPRVSLLGALLIAAAAATLALWLFLLPTHAPPRQLSSLESRPELLDRPHRHRAAQPRTAP
jgi:hypothetical protein